MKKVYAIDPFQDPRWQLFVEKHPRASVYHTTDWLQALYRTYGYRPVVFTTSPLGVELENGIVFSRVQSWLTGRRMVSLPFSDHCEPLVDVDEDWNTLFGYLQANQKQQKWSYVEVRPVERSFQRPGNGGFRPSDSFYLHQIDLSLETNKLLETFDRSAVRDRIRRAELAGVVSESGSSAELLQTFYSLLIKTRRREKLPPQPYKWFRNLMDCMGDAAQIRIARSGEKAVAAMLSLRFADTVIYKYGCSDRKYGNLDATQFLLWKAIESAKSDGAQTFDLGRSDMENEASIHFKNRWVSTPSTLRYWRYPGSRITNFAKGWKSKFVQEVISYMPDGVLTATGDLIYKHFG